MKKSMARWLAAAAAVVIVTAALTACGSPAPDDSTAAEAQNSLAAEKQNSIAEKIKKDKADTKVKAFIVKQIDLSAYRQSGELFNAQNASSVLLPKSVKYADGNVFALGNKYKTMVDKGYSSDRDNEKLKAHTISVNMETQNKKNERIAITMRNASDDDKEMQACDIVTLKYYTDAKRICEDFDYKGVTKDSKLKDILEAFGKTPDTLVLSESQQQAVLTYKDKTSGITLEIQYNTQEDKINTFRLNMQ